MFSRWLVIPALAIGVTLRLHAVVAPSTFYWSGNGSDNLLTTAGNWQGGVAPSSGSNLAFNFDFHNKVSFSGSTTAGSLTFANTQASNFIDFTLTASSAASLTLNSGISGLSSGAGYDVTFGSNLALTLGAAQTWQINKGSVIEVDGTISGTGPLTLNGILLVLKGNNSYSGGTTLVSNLGTSSFATAAIYTSTAFGTGTVALSAGDTVSAHNTLTLANALTIDGTSTTTNPVSLRSADAALVFTGAVNFTTATATGIAVPLNSTYHWPVTLAGSISGVAGASLVKISSGTLFLGSGTGATVATNTYTGGTSILGGSLVFTNSASVPTTGLVKVTSPGYAGISYSATPADLLSSFPFDKSASGSTGVIGFDTTPGASTVTINQPIDLSAAGFANSISLGTATSAVLASNATITPQTNQPYRFAGAGTLTVQSNLGGTSGLSLSGSTGALHLVLQGNNTYTGSTSVTGGVLLIDGAAAAPVSGNITVLNNGYVGATQNALSTLVSTPANFLNLFVKSGSNGLLGFDTTNLASPAAITGAIDLSGFTSSTVGLGTSSAAVYSGTITPPTSGTLRLAAVEGGQLTFNSTIATGSLSLNAISLSGTQGTITLGGANSFTGGVAFGGNGGNLKVIAASGSAFGTGTVTVSSTTLARLETSSALTLPNALTFQSSSSTVTLNLGGANDITLSGIISDLGKGVGVGALFKDGTDLLTLSGANSFSGGITVSQGAIALTNNSATGTGPLQLYGGNATFGGGATAPVIYGLSGDSNAVLTAPNGTAITVNASNSDSDFAGLITGPGGALTTASLTVTGNSSLTLRNANNYSGGTTITSGTIVVANNGALGSGGVTLAATNGTAPGALLGLDRGIAISNPLTLTAGAIVGFGTVSGTGKSPAIGANTAVAPGLPDGSGSAVAGQLTFTNGLELTNGGTYIWLLQDTSLAAGTGWSNLAITGTLAITSTTTPFTLQLESFTTTGLSGTATNFNSALAYSWPIATASGGITGFSPSAFTINAGSSALFGNGFVGANGGTFSLSVGTGATANSLFLNFTPAAVPEPSTIALLGLGLGALAFAGRRRRR